MSQGAYLDGRIPTTTPVVSFLHSTQSLNEYIPTDLRQVCAGMGVWM